MARVSCRPGCIDLRTHVELLIQSIQQPDGAPCRDRYVWVHVVLAREPSQDNNLAIWSMALDDAQRENPSNSK